MKVSLVGGYPQEPFGVPFSGADSAVRTSLSVGFIDAGSRSGSVFEHLFACIKDWRLCPGVILDVLNPLLCS